MEDFTGGFFGDGDTPYARIDDTAASLLRLDTLRTFVRLASRNLAPQLDDLEHFLRGIALGAHRTRRARAAERFLQQIAGLRAELRDAEDAVDAALAEGHRKGQQLERRLAADTDEETLELVEAREGEQIEAMLARFDEAVRTCSAVLGRLQQVTGEAYAALRAV